MEPTFTQPNLMSALMRKRSEVAGMIEHNQLELRRLIAELDHLDATIRIFEPSVDIGSIRAKPVPPRHAAFKGEVTRLVLIMLREANGKPVTSKEIASRLLVERGLTINDPQLNILMVKRVGACLRKMRLDGTAEIVPTNGPLQGWALAKHIVERVRN